jgi:histidine kinase
MGHIVDNVRTFARQSSFKHRRIEPELPLADALELLGEQLKQHGIDLDLQVASDLPRLLGDAERLEQVFVNLLANARDALDALPAEAPRNIRIAVEQDGAHISYAVEDSGGGIPLEHAAQIFEPFFTTKALGEGTGLGLSVSQGIVAEHGGELCCDSAPSGGARFTVRIPIAPDESEA